MASMQKRGISLLLVLVLVFSMIPSVSAAEITTEPGTEPAETTTPVTEETQAAETVPTETTQPEETSPPETTQPETPPMETAPAESEPVEESPTEETQAETAPEEELSLSLMSLDDGVATIADTEIVGAPNAFGNVFLLNGGIDIPSFDHIQHKEHLPLYSVYLKDQPGYENNYYVAYCITRLICFTSVFSTQQNVTNYLTIIHLRESLQKAENQPRKKMPSLMSRQRYSWILSKDCPLMYS